MVYWNEYKIKSDNKKNANEFRYFLESNFVVVNRLFVLVYTNHGDNAKRFNVRRYEEIRKLTTRQGEDYTTGCLLDYDFIKNHYRLIAVDLSRQK